MHYKDKELIIFDLDGTLIDSMPDLAQAINSMLTHFDLTPLTLEEATLFIGNGAVKLVERSLEQALKPKEVTEELFKKAFDFYTSAYREVVCDKTFLYPGVLETLQYLDNKGY